jgi:hypothetical protein
MLMKKRMAAIGMFGLILSGAHRIHGQTPVEERLWKAKTLKCEFTLMSRGTWVKGEVQGETKPVKLTFAFIKINADEGTADAQGMFDPSEIIVRLSNGTLHFVQSFREGPLYTTTVWPKETKNGNLQAVHSRHEFTEVSLPGYTSRPEQYYGECTPN